MKTLLNKIGIIALALTVAFGLGLVIAWNILRDEIKQERQNFRSAVIGLQYRQDSALAVISEKVVSKKEFSELFSPLVQKIEDIDLKVRNIKIASSTVTEHNRTFEVTIRDSTINDTTLAEVVNHRDMWTTFHWIKPVNENRAKVSYHTIDSIFVFYGRDNWKFKNLFEKREWKWYLENANPHNKIVDSQFIKIKR